MWASTVRTEILNSAAILHDPNDFHSFTNDILRLLENDELYNKYKRLGIARAKNFHVSYTAKEIINIFNLFRSIQS